MANKNKKYAFKKFLIGGMLALSVFSTSFIATNLQKIDTGVSASYQQVQSLISNNDFSSYSTSSTPYSPSNWTYENPLNNENIKAGVINTYESEFPDKTDDYKLSENPGIPSGDATGSGDAIYKHLMINSYAGRSRAGYTSGSFTLNANSYYCLDVIVKTVGNAQASIYINGLSDDSVDASITGIINGNWDTHYYIFIETNDFVSENVTIGLWLGGQNDDQVSEGAALFNKVTLTQYSKTTFDSTVRNTNANTSKVVSLKNNYYIENAISNPNFNLTGGDASAITGWTLIESAQNETNQHYKIIDTSSYNAAVDTVKGINNPQTNNMTDDTRVLYINNLSDSQFGIESSSFTLPQSEFYRLTVWTKSDCGVGSGATLKVVEVNPDKENEDFTATTASINCATSVTTAPALNNWTMNTFFLEGHPLKDTQVKLQIWLGDGTNTTGYVFVDNITLEKVNYTVFENASNSGATKYTYNENNTGYSITNGNFNDTKKDNIELTYPLNANSWTLTKSDSVNPEQTTSGVINTKNSQFSLLKNQFAGYGLNISNPGLTPNQIVTGATTENSSNNVLLIGNSVETNQSYLSESFSLSANSYYKLSYLVNTQISTPENNSVKQGVEVTVESSNFTLYNEDNIKTNSDWQIKTVYFKTGANEQTCTIKLGLNNVQGYAFFDDVKLETYTEAEFTALPNNVSKVDLSKETFSLYDKNSTSALNNLYNWTGTNNTDGSNVKFGALNVKNNTNTAISIANPGSKANDNVLMIFAMDDTNFTASSKSTYSLSAGEYYKISVNVKTVNITQENHTYNENNEIIPFGAKIALSGFDKAFTGINTQNNSNPNNDYVTYTFYLSPDGSTTTNLELSLGNENNLSAGYAFFDEVTFATIEESEYLAAQNAESNDKVIILNQVNPDNETNTGNEFTGSEWDWVIVPSLLTALAIIIALVGAMIRQFKFTKKPKIKTSYDRRKTLEVDLNKRERIELRNQIIAELNKEYSDINDEIDELNKQLVADKENLIKLQNERKAEHNKVKQAILVEKQNAIKEYNEKMANLTDVSDKDKQKFEKQFNTFIDKLDKRADREDALSAKETNELEKLNAKHEQKVKRLTERQLFIKQEIERIEREIEAIAKEEEIMWNEYRRAKEEAKKEKLEYLAERRKEKQSKKQSKSTKTEENKELNTQEKSSDLVEENVNEETVKETNNEGETNNQVEVVEPDTNNDDNK